jgi:hypothetical protein
MESNMGVTQKTKNRLPYDPAVPFLGMYLKECTPGYDRARCSATDKWIKYEKMLETENN